MAANGNGKGGVGLGEVGRGGEGGLGVICSTWGKHSASPSSAEGSVTCRPGRLKKAKLMQLINQTQIISNLLVSFTYC